MRLSVKLQSIAIFECLVAFSSAQAHAHTDNVPAAARLGSVSFEISCKAGLQADFNHAVVLLHSFWHDEAERAFEKVASADPQCAIAYWGEAMTHFHQYLGEPTPADLASGNQALAKADAASEKDAREAAYIHALHLLYDGYTPQDPFATAKRYADAMGALVATYPRDLEAKVFYALALLVADPPDDVELVSTRKAAEILKPLLREHPNHPGIAHYLIHACDNPQMAQEGLEAARRYALIAPASPHALHMPSHIFARLGLWQEDIRSNLASKAVSENKTGMHIGAENRLHAMEFLEYAYLQIGHDDEARAIIAEAKTIKASEVDPRYASYYPIVEARFPALFAIETRDWATAAHLEPAPGDDGAGRGLTLLAHAIAAGHLHDRSLARATVQSTDALMAKLRQGRPVPLPGTAGATLPDEVDAWTAFAQGDLDRAVRLLRPIADRQAKVGKGEVELPAREMLAEMLLLSAKEPDALHEYQLSLKSDPNRFNGLLGAGSAAEQAGQRELAVTYYRTVLTNSSGATEPALGQLEHARAVVSARSAQQPAGIAQKLAAWITLKK
jgi:hypothetical protein